MIDINRFRAACNKAIEMGWTILSGTTRDENAKTCCALGAVSVVESLSNELTYYDIGRCLGLNVSQTAGLITGFDGHHASSFDVEAYDIGKQLRVEFLTPVKQGV
jgi:hypothetical protein